MGFSLREAGGMALAALALLLWVWWNNGSFYDQGDSVMHYLIAHGALTHPELYFDHWGKPLFTLLASGFTIWGWPGMKLFNLLAVLGAGTAVYLLMKQLQTPFATFALVLFWMSPGIMLVTSSGLTEPLFACTLALAVLAWSRNLHHLAALLCSLLPLIRSEGIVLLFVWMAFTFFYGNRRTIPWLFAGILLISLAGMPGAGKSMLWFFLENPYPLKAESYGSGPWLHYFKNYLSLAGLPHYLLFLTGVADISIRLFHGRKQKPDHAFRLTCLIFSLCLAFFIFHSVAWGTGLMGSFGMIRVLVSVMPLASVIAAKGGHRLLHLSPVRMRPYLSGAFLIWLFVFPFTPSVYAIQKPLDRLPDEAERLCLKAGNIATEAARGRPVCFFYEEPLLTLAIGNDDPYRPPALDYFDSRRRRSIREHHQAKEGDVLIWDAWFAPGEAGVPLTAIDADTLRLERISILPQPGSAEIRYAIFRVKPKR